MLKNAALLIVMALLFFFAASDAEAETTKEPIMTLKKVTPVLLADNVKACVDFWSNFDLEMTMSVPEPGGLMFAILTNEHVELMYQSIASAQADNAAAVEGVNKSVIFIEVESIDSIVPVAQQYEVVKPLHDTPYGSREIYIRDPAGHLVGFAEQGAAEG